MYYVYMFSLVLNQSNEGCLYIDAVKLYMVKTELVNMVKKKTAQL